MNKDGFKIPENYFDAFPKKMLQKVNTKKKNLSVILSLSIAASFLIVFFSVQNLLFPTDHPMQKNICQISDVEYFDINMTEIYDICDNNTENKELEDTELIDFLIEDESDYEYILNE